MFKKITALFLAVLLIAGLCTVITSCNDDATNNGDEIEMVKKEKGILDTIPEITLADDAKAGIKVGLICLHDENSTYDKNFIDAFKRAQEELGLNDDQIVIVTNVGEDATCYEEAKKLANAGCTAVFADSFGHESYMLQAAQEFPNVQFCHATGTMAHTENQANFHDAFASIYEGRYLAGVVAGLKLNEMISAGKFSADQAKMGYVGAWPYAEVISGYTSFYLGAKSVCPTVTMSVKYTNSWYDEAKEKTAAEALIQEGCKLISQHADSMGAPKACENASVPNVSYNGSTTAACPNTALISSYIDWTPYFTYMIKAVATNTPIHNDYCGGLAAGSVKLTELNTAVAAEGTQAKLDELIAKFKAGTLAVFDTTTFTVGGKTLEKYAADVDFDEAFAKDTHVVWDGKFMESYFRSAPYFDIIIDGITVEG